MSELEKSIITFSANEQNLQKTGGIGCYASDTVSYIEAHFALGENWSGYDSIRAVWFNDYKTISTVLDSDGVCIVPHEVLTSRGKVMVNLVGSVLVSDELSDRLTTFPCEALKVSAKAKISGSETAAVTPSQFEQFVASVRNDADRADAGAESAEASASEASASAEQATASAQASEASALRASGHAQNAQSAETSARAYAQNAQNYATDAENAKDDAIDARDEIRSMRANAETLEPNQSATASYSNGVLTLGIPKGQKGDTGDTGETGDTPNISVGNVTTLEPSEDAYVTRRGTDANPIFDFGIPKGDKGDTGEVSQAEFDEAVADLKSDFENAFGIKSMSFQNGYIDIVAPASTISFTRITSGTAASSGVLPCASGDVISVNILGKGAANGGAQAWAFVDAEMKVINRSGPTKTLNYTELTAPENAAYIVVNTYFSEKPDSYCFNGKLTKTQISNIQNELNELTPIISRTSKDTNVLTDAVVPYSMTWERVTVNVSNGNFVASTTRIGTDYIPSEIETITAIEGYEVEAAAYNSEDVYVGIVRDSNGNNISKMVTWLSSLNFAKIRQNRDGYNFRVVLRKSDDSVIDESASQHISYFPTSSLDERITNNANDISKLEQVDKGITPDVWSLPTFETVVATWKNYLIKCEDVEGVNCLRFSNDLGNTFTDIENTWGDVVNTHFFSDGSVLICFPTECIVVSNDFATITPSVIYDYDGSIFVPTNRHFYSYNYDEIHVIDGVEVYAFGDYIVNSTASRIWYTIDGGHTIKCAFKFGSTQINGETISVRHVHGIYYNKYNQHWYIATGDTASECYIIQADYNPSTDNWTFQVLAQGAEFKLTGWWFDELYTYFCTDYTTDSPYYTNKGILRVRTDQLSDYSKYAFVYKAPQSEFGEIALSKLIVDPNGHKFVLPDYKGNGVLWYADYGWNFKKITFGNAQLWLDGMTFGPNYDGDVYVVTYNSSAATDQSILKYNRNVINLTKMARENGVPAFYKNTTNSMMLSR